MRNRRYQALIQEKADLLAEAGRIHDGISARQDELPEQPTDDQRASAGMTDTERQRDDQIHARLEEISDLLSREERMRDHQRGEPSQRGDSTAPEFEPDTTDTENPRAMAGFHNAADFALAVRAACLPGGGTDPRLQPLGSRGAQAAPADYHETGGASGEGYMIPPAMRNEIWQLVFDTDERDLLNLVELEPTERNSVELIRDESTPWGSTGVSASWRAEGSQMSPSKLETDAEQVRLHELYAFSLSTEEMLSDGPRLASRLTVQSARAIRYKASDALMRGTGAGQPLGWLNSDALVSVAEEGSQDEDTVEAANVAKMFSRIIGPGQGVWLINQDVFPQLFLMTLGDQPIYFPPQSGIREAPGGFLLGRPVLPNEHCSTLGDQGDIQFVNPRGYYGTQKAGGIQFATSIHLYFDYNMQAFRWTFRLGGQPFLSAPVSPDHGDATRSHFVVLDERAGT